MLRNVHARFRHDFDGVRVQAVFLDPRRIRLEHVAFQVARPAFSHLAAAGVSGAEEQDFQFRHWRLHNSTGSMASTFLRRAASSAERGSLARDLATQRIASRAAAEAPLPGRE